MSLDKALIILRHAHRDKNLGRELDNGLSKKGKSQAEKIAEYLNNKLKNKTITLASSPKKRCLETLQPFSILSQRKIKILSCLDEGEPLESKFYVRQAKFTESC